MFEVHAKLLPEQILSVRNILIKLLSENTSTRNNLSEVIGLLQNNFLFEQLQTSVLYSIRNDNAKDNRIYITFSIRDYDFIVAQYNYNCETNASYQDIVVSDTRIKPKYRYDTQTVFQLHTYKISSENLPLVSELNVLYWELIKTYKVNLKVFLKTISSSSSDASEFLVSRTFFPLLSLVEKAFDTFVKD